jgi:NCS1 family nucleobase:cation symporter-1
MVTFAMIGIIISTLATNIAANIVSPANDFSNLSPKKINFKLGGYITGVIGVLIFPWKLMADPNGYIFTWLIAYSSLLGPIGGIMIADYYFIRKKELAVDELYQHKGRYNFSGGINPVAIIALLAGILPNVPGFLLAINAVAADSVPAWINGLYHYAWFVGFFVSGVVYWICSNKSQRKEERSSVYAEASA